MGNSQFAVLKNSTNRVKLSRKHNTEKHKSSTMATTCALDQIANVKLNDNLVGAIIRADWKEKLSTW